MDIEREFLILLIVSRFVVDVVYVRGGLNIGCTVLGVHYSYIRAFVIVRLEHVSVRSVGNIHFRLDGYRIIRTACKRIRRRESDARGCGRGILYYKRMSVVRVIVLISVGDVYAGAGRTGLIRRVGYRLRIEYSVYDRTAAAARRDIVLRPVISRLDEIVGIAVECREVLGQIGVDCEFGIDARVEGSLIICRPERVSIARFGERRIVRGRTVAAVVTAAFAHVGKGYRFDEQRARSELIRIAVSVVKTQPYFDIHFAEAASARLHVERKRFVAAGILDLLYRRDDVSTAFEYEVRAVSLDIRRFHDDVDALHGF